MQRMTNIFNLTILPMAMSLDLLSPPYAFGVKPSVSRRPAITVSEYELRGGSKKATAPLVMERV